MTDTRQAPGRDALGREHRAAARTAIRPAAALTAAALAALVPLAAAGPVASAEPVPDTPITEAPLPSVLPSTTSSSYFVTPRDLTGCPFQTSPPPPVDESEVPRPGQTSPAPPPVPETPAGGEALDTCDVVAPDGFDVPRDITASAWMVTDLDSGEIIAAKDPHGRYRPASIIKTLLASVAIDELDEERIISVTDADLDGAEGSLVGVGPGGKYSITRLLSGLLMASGNDAAVVLAHQMGGIDATIDAMNAHAAALGATSTHAGSVNGLDAPGMMTSAYDMSLIWRDAMSRPEFADIVATQMTGFPGYPAGEGAGPPDPHNPPPYSGPTTRADGEIVNPGFVLANDNQLLYNYEGALGGKTGLTDDARHTFIGSAERDGRRLAVVLLDGTRLPKAPWEQAAILLDSGFSTEESVGQLGGGAGSGDGSDGLTALAAGSGDVGAAGLGGSGSGEAVATNGPDRIITVAGGSLIEEYGPWLAVGAAGLVVLVGCVLTLRSRR
ncbi:D-alanyl-D-alanine carboxypeptidase family protein [Dietzia sp. NCCP-2495]|uniref:D-alanyl-D-alanine carboxypeptidase family protein n=1 Tax=Dietzia sp. NCCP-2495 TaxID=2934675 RepID=UPI00222F7D54|nr:D-alanyl-D-alanine carboxypeptidase family protein [Dietzia sp. NCCP-2495]